MFNQGTNVFDENHPGRAWLKKNRPDLTHLPTLDWLKQLKRGMEEKAEEFVKQGGEVYQKV